MPRSVVAPSYFYPGATDTSWAKVIQAAMYVSVVLLNPDSGPGAERLQEYATVVQQSQAAGIKVLGGWYGVDGIFVDEMYAVDTSKVQFYQQIHDAVKGSAGQVLDSASSIQLIFNPGQPVVPEAYLPLADTFLTFEGPAESYQNFSAADYTVNYPSSKFWHVVYRCSSNATIDATLSQFNSQHAEYLYVTDLDQPNPYYSLPDEKTWAQLLAYVASTRLTTASIAPESGSSILRSDPAVLCVLAVLTLTAVLAGVA
ncbi:hypothetical protein ABBQ32_006729 [Trebouxia sp. C0010 RCD-2024]